MVANRAGVIVSLMCAVLILTFMPASGSDLALEHWAYDYLDRLKVKGLLDDCLFLNQTRPLSREDVAAAIWQITQHVSAGDVRISDVERSQLEWLQREFAEELQDHPLPTLPQERRLFSWSDGKRGVVIETVGQGRGSLGRVHDSSRRLLDLRAVIRTRGFLGKELSYAASVVKGQVRSNLDRVTEEDVGLTGYFDRQGSYGYYDWSHAHVNVRFPWFEIQLGRQPVSWGPGIRGNLALSSHPPAYDFIHIRAGVRRVRFIHLHGSLMSEMKREYITPEGFSRSEYANKFLAAHRLEVAPVSWLEFGLTEAIIYGERDLDLAYVNPLVFFWSAQHSSHDRDNEAMGADLWIRPVPGMSLYGALFLDEIYLKKVFAEDARNKVAVQGGIYLVDLMGLEDTDLRMEYARVQPCVYTHKFVANTYRHDGVCLGHWLEENGDDLYLAARHRFSRQIRVAVEVARTRQGEKGELPWCHTDSGRYHFLWGTVEETVALGISMDLEPLHDVNASLSLWRFQRENKDHQAGEDETLHEISLTLRFEH